MEDGNMEMVKKLEDELKVMSSIVKGRCKNLENVKVYEDVQGTSKPDMFKMTMALYDFSKKLLVMLKGSNNDLSASDIPSLVRKELTDLLPGLLKEVLNANVVTETKTVEESPKESHTLTLEKIPDGEETEKLSEGEWTTVVRGDVTKALKNVPVLKAKKVEGAATFSFRTKEDMDSARDALSDKYKVTPKTQEWKKLDPKLTLTDLDPEISTKEDLEEKILEKNAAIRQLKDTGEVFKIVFLDEKERLAVLQVSARIRECIRDSDDRICVDLQQHRVKDRFHIIQCFHCQGHGHMSGSPHCKKKEEDSVCFYCAGAHASKDCKNRKEKKTASVKCYNCSNSKSSRERSGCKTHNATDYLCPFYIREKERLMSRTHCSEDLKNDYLKKVKALQVKFGRS